MHKYFNGGLEDHWEKRGGDIVNNPQPIINWTMDEATFCRQCLAYGGMYATPCQNKHTSNRPPVYFDLSSHFRKEHRYEK